MTFGTEEGKRLLVLVAESFQKSRIREIGILLHSNETRKGQECVTLEEIK